MAQTNITVIDYNGQGRWSRSGLFERAAALAAKMGLALPDLSPREFSQGGQQWVYPVMSVVIDRIEAGDAVCIYLGIEFIEEDSKFPFGKILKSNTARALRRAALSEDQDRRIKRRVFGMLRDGHVPHEFREYAKLVRKIGFTHDEIPAGTSDDPFVEGFRAYFISKAQS